MLKTAGIIIIGDEVLSGKVEDVNSSFAAKGLRLKGIDVRRISVISDDVGEIAAETINFSRRYDYVFTSGGLGPTHDDVTIEGISKGFGVDIAIHGDLKAILVGHYGDKLTPERLKMAEVPAGSELIKHASIKFPIIQFKNVYILPGQPELFRDKFKVLEQVLSSELPILLTKVYITEYESEIAPSLNVIVAENKDVKIGSYPVMRNADYRVMLTLESMDGEALNRTIKMITNGDFKDKVLRVEGEGADGNR
ncbi:competence/damage-inducible protein A [Candidatus Magnetominusculus dajiuhuensis]|uniref:competence/damage-inducible protein A n=1 Tax=Candidatus Magnetominusculus dajiuhuensis TaxID=3137712 RepID=UPI003B433F88